MALKTNLRSIAMACAVALTVSACSHPSGMGQFSSRAQLDPNVDSALRLAEASRASGDYNSAVALYRDLLKKHADEPRLYIGLGNTLFDAGEYDEALDAYTRASEIDGNQVGAWDGVGRTKLARFLPNDAKSAFDKALAIDPANVVALNGSGVAADMRGQPAEAQEFYRRVLAIEPGNRAAKNNLALSYGLAGRTQEAIGLLSDIALSPDAPPRMRHNLALVYGMSGNEKAAADLTATELTPDTLESNRRFYELMRASWGTGSDAVAMQARTLNRPLANAETETKTEAASQSVAPVPVAITPSAATAKSMVGTATVVKPIKSKSGVTQRPTVKHKVVAKKTGGKKPIKIKPATGGNGAAPESVPTPIPMEPKE